MSRKIMRTLHLHFAVSKTRKESKFFGSLGQDLADLFT